jgi:peptidyl-prolyl cis-trans isomerase-like protein 2
MGGKVAAQERSLFRPLPFNCCALTMQPFQNPVMTPSGAVFDIVALVPWITTHKTDPTTGDPLTLKQIVKLTFHKAQDGKYFCPITNKVIVDMQQSLCY